MNVSIVIMVVYLVVVTAVGSALARRSKGPAQWAVAGGGMGAVVVAFGIAGTRIGGAAIYGVAGDVINEGVWNAWWYGINTFLALTLVGVFFAVPYRRLKLQTVSEIFRIRFGSQRSQALSSLCVQTEYMIVNIIEAYVIGVMMVGLLSVDMILGVALAAIILITYTVLGGLWGSAFTNMIHCAVILAGLFLVGALGVRQAGGWDVVVEQVNAHVTESGKDRSKWWGIAGGGWLAVIGMFFSATIHTPAASVYVNFSTAARNEKTLPLAFCLAGLMGAVMPILAGFVGVITLARYGYTKFGASYESITKVAQDINPVVGGIALAAVLAAVVSSGGPILLSSATMFVRDWLPFTRNYDSAKKLFAYRIVTIVYGIIAAILAWYIKEYTKISVLDLLLFGFAMVVPPAIVVGYLIYWRRTTEAGAFWGMLSGYVAGLAWFGLIKYASAIEFAAPEGYALWRRAFHYCFVNTGAGIDPSYATTVVPLLVVPLVSLLTSSKDNPAGEFYDVLAGRKTAADAA